MEFATPIRSSVPPGTPPHSIQSGVVLHEALMTLRTTGILDAPLLAPRRLQHLVILQVADAADSSSHGGEL